MRSENERKRKKNRILVTHSNPLSPQYTKRTIWNDDDRLYTTTTIHSVIQGVNKEEQKGEENDDYSVEYVPRRRKRKKRPREKKKHHVDIYPFAPSSFLYSIQKSTSMHREECCPGARLNIYIYIWIGEFTDQNKYPINQRKRKRFSRESSPVHGTID